MVFLILAILGSMLYLNSWQRFTEMSLSDKKEFYCNSTMEDITYVDYNYKKRVWCDFLI